MQELLFEIGVEEIPARFLPGAMDNLKAAAKKRLEESGIVFSALDTFATPRRLALMAGGLPDSQPDRVREVFGPPKKAAFDKDGNPTKALTGFAASLGARPEDLVVRQKNSGLYMAALIREQGSPLKEVLPAMLREIVISLSFPKSMRWADGNIRFVRPIRWITALLGGETLAFEIDGIKSGDLTRGHRFLSPGAIRIREAGAYENILKAGFVIASPARRREMVLEDLSRLAGSVGGRPVLDGALLDTVVNLVEYPVGMLCEFPREYLELPEELLVTVMQDHQKYFAVMDERDRLLNYFIVIANTLKENYFVVKAGSERVIRARFEDARFYYHEDQNRTLLERVDDLKKVAFHERLGSVADKVGRVETLAAYVAEAVCPESAGLAVRAALLSKSDLVTGVVREFPELQGIMGRYYAANDGEPEEVAQAIQEQYLPRHAGGALPQTNVGAVLALADRLDNIVSFFYLRLAPTGSEDPFALRRQATACALILIENGYELTILSLVDKAAQWLGGKDAALEAEITRFFQSRLPQIFEAKGLESDITDSLLPLASEAPLRDILERGVALRRLRQYTNFGPFLLAIKRVKNILPQGKKLPPEDPGLFREPAEKDLAQRLSALEASVHDLISGHFYER
ncbi:MAG: glycine--tRNA ligase subunit beta, partial [Nitrospiraceae bacterium]|nr:glycine--tRNA ligase subunit beta [Nitrospiraceae bacterium]